MGKRIKIFSLLLGLVCIMLLAGVIFKRCQENTLPVKKMLIVGDSIGIGTGASDLELKWYKLLPLFMKEQYGIKLDIINVSMGGNTSFAGYSRIMDLDEDYFDYVVICYGENDSLDDFSLYYESILRAIYWRYPGSQVLAILESSQREYTDKIKIIQDLSSHYGAWIVDMIAAFNSSGMPYDALTDDGTHPNDKGQQLYYEAVRDVLQEIYTQGEVMDRKKIAPVNEEVEEFRNYKSYKTDEFKRINEMELELEVSDTMAMLGISYTPIMGENQILLYADEGLILDKKFNWEHSFIQDYIELVDKKKVKFSRLKIVFGAKEQRDNFQGVILTAFDE